MRKAFICPTKYVQGEDELANLGYFIRTFGTSALLIAHPDDAARVSSKLSQTCETFGVTIVESGFNGQCSRGEVARLEAMAADNGCDCIVGLGGGKALDTAKCVAKGEALIICPTIAATDAPTSHSAVLYHDDGAFDDYAYFKQSPSVVLVDTTVIAQAPTRFLVAGMGDALSTYFEARANMESRARVNASLPCGAREGLCPPARSTNAAFALATTCYQTLLEDGAKAKAACDCNVVTPALENIVEANILLSGLGFESGGLAAAHAIYDGMSVLEGTHAYYHGEQVAFGTLCQLVLEGAPTSDIETVLDFCAAVGLPTCLSQIGVDSITDDELMAVAEKTCIPEESVHSMPFPVSPATVAAAIKTADRVGSAFAQGR